MGFIKNSKPDSSVMRFALALLLLLAGCASTSEDDVPDPYGPDSHVHPVVYYMDAFHIPKTMPARGTKNPPLPFYFKRCDERAWIHPPDWHTYTCQSMHDGY